MLNSGLQLYFDKVFISEEVKSPKPDPIIFEYAIKSTNAKKASSLMVGDDYDVDIKGALDFGIDAVFFCPSADKRAFYEKEKSNVKVVGGLNQLRLFL